MQALSVLQNARKSDVRLDPYPHIVLDNALPSDLYDELVRSFPPLLFMGIFRGANNRRWNFTNRMARRNFLIPKLWREFLAYHSSQAFFNDVLELFYDGIHALYPGRYPSIEGLRAMKVGARYLDAWDEKDSLLEAMISGNTPVTKASSVRTTHVDAGDKLFSGLLYMRPDDYDAVGGDLTISRFKPQYATEEAKLSCFRGAYVNDDLVDVVETIKYAKNRLVLFINSLDSLHGVTVRQPTRQSRVFVNLVGEVDPPLYTLPEKVKTVEAA